MPTQIRAPEFFPDSNGNPATGYKVYISEPNTDPKDESKRLIITDGNGGVPVSNPFVINSKGYAKNNDGQLVNPVIQEQAYAILFESIGGGQQYTYPNITSDAFGLTSGGSSTADQTFNNFPLAQSTNLNSVIEDGSGFIFIQSITEGWESTVEGPQGSYYAHYTGGSGAPQTGTFDLFYDAAGNEWKISEVSQLPLTNEENIATKISSAIVTVITASNPAFVPNVNTKIIEVEGCGGGGGGGSVHVPNVGDAAAATGGSGGCYFKEVTSIIDSTYNISIGAGGAGGTGAGGFPGDSGGDTTITSLSMSISAPGGLGGAGGVASSAARLSSAGAISGVSTGASVNGSGDGSNSCIILSGEVVTLSTSGGSFLGGQVSTSGIGDAGVSATINGAGGSGANGRGSTAINLDGGDGAPGIVIIKEFF